MSRPERGAAQSAKKKPRQRFPWLLLLLLLGSIYLFWILPAQRGRQPVNVTFQPATPQNK